MPITDIHTERIHLRYKRYQEAPLLGLYYPEERQLFALADFVIDGHRKSMITMGRAPKCDIKLDDPTISMVHCELIIDEDGQYVVQDADSTNGLFVNEIRITKAKLSPGMWLFLGRTELVAMGPNCRIPVTATTYSSFLHKASSLYGSDRKAAKYINKSPSTIRRGRLRYQHKRMRLPISDPE